MTEAYLGNPNLYKANLPQSYTEEQVKEIRKLAKNGVPVSKILQRFGTSDANIRSIIHRKSWKHVD